MMRISICLATVMLALVETSAARSEPVKPHRAAPHKAAPVASRPGSPAGNINVPSTDFSTVQQDDGSSAERARGGSIRPSISEGGQLGFGAGF